MSVDIINALIAAITSLLVVILKLAISLNINYNKI